MHIVERLAQATGCWFWYGQSGPWSIRPIGTAWALHRGDGVEFNLDAPTALLLMLGHVDTAVRAVDIGQCSACEGTGRQHWGQLSKTDEDHVWWDREGWLPGGAPSYCNVRQCLGERDRVEPGEFPAYCMGGRTMMTWADALLAACQRMWGIDEAGEVVRHAGLPRARKGQSFIIGSPDERVASAMAVLADELSSRGHPLAEPLATSLKGLCPSCHGVRKRFELCLACHGFGTLLGATWPQLNELATARIETEAARDGT